MDQVAAPRAALCKTADELALEMLRQEWARTVMSGFYLSPMDMPGHVATPMTGAYAKENSESADLMNETACPVMAVRRKCVGTIRLDHQMQMEWRHVSAAGDAS
jgi:hypothetical protein